ncbi:MAG: serine/threonine-protein kinase [Bryobacter sp.]|nr:serine/threonine-protein kinase [Bryobacter sp.]
MSSLNPSQRWQRVQELADRLEPLAPHVRQEMLAALEPDASIRAEVQSLLFALAQEPLAAPPEPSQAKNTATLPESISHYRVESLLGQGGTGTVYAVTREVHGQAQPLALKVLHQAFNNEESQSRFRREQQILARLAHPSIIRWLDSGFTADGQPFLVMERVDGKPIDAYVRERKLSPEAILLLMLEVCEAVAEAHRNLVLHLDLKPSNIFVNKQGHAKLLDFGTAKLLDAESTWTTTRQLTPLYASPEQLRGDPLNTAADVYSLGLILYELLTGAWPFGEKGSFLSVAGRLEGSVTMRRVRGLTDGDLAIVLEKALASEPAQRYRTVNEFAEDLRRYQAGQPILARRQTFSYRASKYIRRHRTAVGLAAIFAFGLAASSVYSFVQYRKAETERARAVAVAGFLEQMLANADPTQQTISPEKGLALRVVDLLDASAAQAATLEKSAPSVAVSVRSAIAGGYKGLGQYEKAEIQARTALALAQSGFGNDSWEYLVALESLASAKKAASQYALAAPLQQQVLSLYEALAPLHNGYEKALSSYAGTLVNLGRATEALPFAEKALRLTQSRTGDLEDRAYAMVQLAFVYNALNRNEDYLRILEEAVALRRTLPAPSLNHGAALANLAHALHKIRNYNRALSTQEEAVAFYKARLGPQHPAVVQALVSLAVMQSQATSHEQALITAAEAKSLSDLTWPNDHKDRAYAHTVWGHLACKDDAQRLAAVKALEFGLAMRQRILGANHGEVMGGHWNLAQCLDRLGDYLGALPHVEATYRIVVTEKYPAAEIRETVEYYAALRTKSGQPTTEEEARQSLERKLPAGP